MNAATLSRSERLQRVDKFLSDGLWHSTMEIIHGANVCAVNSIASELRVNGRHIITRCRKGVYYYRMVKPEEKAA